MARKKASGKKGNSAKVVEGDTYFLDLECEMTDAEFSERARETRIVPCGRCTECCQADATFIHPECGDNADEYEVAPYQGRWILAHKINGDCFYLDRKRGCTIWERRPVVCRELDCRNLLRGSPELQRLVGKRTIRAAQRLERRHPSSP